MLSLAWAVEPELVNATLEYALSDAVRAQDAPMLIRAVAKRGGASLEAAWSFLRGYVPASVHESPGTVVPQGSVAMQTWSPCGAAAGHLPL